MLVVMRVDPLDGLCPDIVVGQDIVEDTSSVVAVPGVIDSTSLDLEREVSSDDLTCALARAI